MKDHVFDRIFRFSALLVTSLTVFATTSAAQSPDYDRAFSQATVKVGRWHLQSNPLVNLHERLMYQTRFNDEKPPLIEGEDLVKWNKAVDQYRSFVGKRDPINDRDLTMMNLALSAATGFTAPDSLPKAAARVLDEIMPIYRKDQWPQDDRTNRFCMSLAAPMLESAGEELILANERAYDARFPTHILVDVVAVGWQFGAYTVGDVDHAHVVIQSQNNPAAEGLTLLESLIHEPSHVVVGSTTDAIGADLARLSKELGIRPYANLWHAILFYTAGETTRQALARRGVYDYKPVVLDMYSRAFKGFREPLEKYWQPYLDRKISKDEALRKIILETAPPSQKREVP